LRLARDLRCWHVAPV